MEKGFFGQYGGAYTNENTEKAVKEVAAAYEKAKNDESFQREFHDLLENYAGRPSMLYFASRLTERLGGAKIYLKREDLNHTGAHKINNVLGQMLLAKRMGKTKVIAETGAGQHGVATATCAALLGLECTVFMGGLDMERQALNVCRIKMLGASVTAAGGEKGTLSDAVEAAFAYWSENYKDTYYVVGSCVGPHPYPTMVRDFQSVISYETKEQMLKKEGRLPDYVVACVGGGSNAIGSFYGFLNDSSVKLIGCEASGKGGELSAASLSVGRAAVAHGMKSYFCMDGDEIRRVECLSAGLDYPGVGPEHAFLKDSGRASYVEISDDEALAAFNLLCRTEGIIPALESSHAVAYAAKLAPALPKDSIIVVTLSGRGDKDVALIAQTQGMI